MHWLINYSDQNNARVYLNDLYNAIIASNLNQVPRLCPSHLSIRFQLLMEIKKAKKLRFYLL